MSWQNIIKAKKYPQWDKLGMQDGRGKAMYYAELLHGFHKHWGSGKYDVKEAIKTSLKKVGWGHINLDFLDDLD